LGKHEYEKYLLNKSELSSPTAYFREFRIDPGRVLGEGDFKSYMESRNLLSSPNILEGKKLF